MTHTCKEPIQPVPDMYGSQICQILKLVSSEKSGEANDHSPQLTPQLMSMLVGEVIKHINIELLDNTQLLCISRMRLYKCVS